MQWTQTHFDKVCLIHCLVSVAYAGHTLGSVFISQPSATESDASAQNQLLFHQQMRRFLVPESKFDLNILSYCILPEICGAPALSEASCRVCLKRLCLDSVR